MDESPESPESPGSQLLRPEAAYGKLIFDVYLAKHGDADAPNTALHWADLVKAYLALGNRGREPYRLATLTSSHPMTPEEIELRSCVLTQGQIANLVEQFQTVQERNCLVRPRGTWKPVWLRTCYTTGSDDDHEEILAGVELDKMFELWRDADGDDFILNDATRYTFKKDWPQIFTKLPGLCDGGGKGGDEARLQQLRQVGDEYYLLENSVANYFFVADRLALKSGEVLIITVDQYGDLVMSFRMHVNECELVSGLLLSGLTWGEIPGHDWEERIIGPKYQRGALRGIP